MASIGPILLARGNVVRIVGGQGTRVLATGGALWVSEEGSPEDHVLTPGETVTLRHAGKGLVLALHPARAYLEIPQGVVPPRVVEVASADGVPGRRIRGNAGTPAEWLAHGFRACVAWIGWALGSGAAQRGFTRSSARRA